MIWEILFGDRNDLEFGKNIKVFLILLFDMVFDKVWSRATFAPSQIILA
jgi:hypothetical protein